MFKPGDLLVRKNFGWYATFVQYIQSEPTMIVIRDKLGEMTSKEESFRLATPDEMLQHLMED